MAAKRKPESGKRRFGAWRVLFKIALAAFVVLAIGLIYLDALITTRFEGLKWAIPAKVYGRALELWPGAEIGIADVELELRRLGYRETAKADSPGSFLRNGPSLSVHTRGFSFWDEPEPSRRLRLHFAAGRLSGIQSIRGQSVPLVRLEPPHIGGIYPAHNEDRLLVRLDEVPQRLVDALIAVEDRAFREHHGVSIKGILRAAWVNMRSGQIEQGGSTLTQQLVKNFYLTSERSMIRKALEAVIALLLEVHYDKGQILETYLNEVYLGQDGHRAIHGFGLASQYYFNRPLAELDVDQQALLVALVRGPSYYDPWRHPERALARRNLILQKLAQENLLGGADVSQLQRRALRIGLTRRSAHRQYPAYLDLVRRQLRRDYSDDSLSSEGLQIFTAFDPVIQEAAETALRDTLEQIDANGEHQLEGAVIVLAPDSAEVKAVVGGRQARFAGFNRALDAVRPVGSLIKPAVFLTALATDRRYTLLSLLDDSGINYRGEDGAIWAPDNFDKREHGTVPMHEALSRSYNLATARLGLDLGVDRVLDTVRRLGVTRSLPELPAILLGAAGLSPLEVASMYLTIAGGGFNTPMRSIQDILDAHGDPLNRYPFQLEREFDAESIHLLDYMLLEAMREGTGKSAYRKLPQDFVMAGKTGTTNDLRDAWFAGFAGDLLAVVWVGRDDNGPTGQTGSSAALPVWTSLAGKLSPQSLKPVVPPGVHYLWIESETGRLTEEGCDGARYMPFRLGSEPKLSSNCSQPRDRVVRDWWKRLFG